MRFARWITIVAIALVAGGWTHGGGGNFLLNIGGVFLLDGSSVKLTAN